MKVKKIEAKRAICDLDYPCLIEYCNTGNVVLVTGSIYDGWFTGILLYTSEDASNVGHKTDTWTTSGYKLYEGKLELSN